MTSTVERLLMDLTPVPAFVFDFDTLEFLDVNAALTRMSGYSRDELLAMRVDVDYLQLASLDGCVVPLHTKSGGTVRLALQFRITDADRRRVVVAIAAAAGPSKLEALGRLAVGIAHDFNNVLGVIVASAEVAREQLPGSEELVEIEHACEHAASLTRQLLTVVRDQPVVTSTVDPNVVLAALERMLRRVLGSDIAVCVELGEVCKPARIDRDELEQIVLNLVINARDAMPTGGTLGIATQTVRVGCQDGIAVAPGDYVVITISDTGCGMTMATRARAFDAFFTTKPTGQGTGLGLATALEIARRNGGTIAVDSEPGRGSSFRVYVQRAG